MEMAVGSAAGMSALHAAGTLSVGPRRLDGELASVGGSQFLHRQALAGVSWTVSRLPTGLAANRQFTARPSCKFHRTTFAKKTRKAAQPTGFGIRKTDGMMAERLKEADPEDAPVVIAPDESTKRAQSEAEASTSAPSMPVSQPPKSPPPPVSSQSPSVPLPDEEVPPVAAETMDATTPTEDAAQLHPPTSLPPSTPSPPTTRPPKERERPPGITVEDLMHMIKDAEKNILLLNRVRTRAVEDLDQAKTENEVLKGQIEVLKARLLESEAKVKLAVQVKAKNQLLENQVEVLQGRVNEMDTEMKGLLSLGQENTVLHEQIAKLQARVQESEARAAQLAPSQSENEALREKAQKLEAQFSEMSAKEKLTSAERTANEKLREQIRELEVKLNKAEAAQELAARAEAETQELKEEVQKLKGTLFKAKISARLAVEGETGTSSRVQAEILQEQVELLRASLAEATAEREVLKESEAENALLRGQVEMLEKRLLASDAEIRSQLELYQREVEAFEDRISENGIMQVPIGEMPWDFWSNLLLRIDALMIGKYLTLDQSLDLRLMAWQRDARIRDVYAQVQDEKLFSDEDVASGLKELVKVEKRPGMHIIHIAAEMAPVAKVGGLADVVTGLGRALQKKGHLVEFILPKYDNMDYTRIKDLKVMEQDFFSYFEGEMFKNKIWRGIVEGLPVYFLEPHHPGRFFWRGQFYGCEDDFRRFTYFCRAALEFLYKTKKKPDIIHSHDWQTAAIAPLYWDVYNKLGMDSAQVAFTCHNFEYQGTAPPGALTACGLNPDRFYNQERMQDNFMLDRINLLKGGIVFSTIVTTVSPTYAQEVRGPEGGRGLHPTLARHSRKFFGILNGIDDDAWNPATDPLLEYQYSAEDTSGKAANKMALRARLGLSSKGQDADRPLVGCVTRLVPQKGVHLIRHAIFRTLERGGQFILLGSSPVPSIQNDFENIARQFSNHPHICLVLKYDESLSHSIYAASDMFIIPSMFEPCGLTQLIAMRYGSVPIARKTGGLNDSVFDVDDRSIPENQKNGFTFSATDEQGMNYALDRALNAYYDSRAWWQSLVSQVMAMDFSWEKPSEQFIELYRNALTKAAPR